MASSPNPAKASTLPIGPRFDTMDAVIEGLGALEQALYAARDRRAVFATAYVNMTIELKRRIALNAFADNDWVARYAVAFANLYRNALVAFESGDLDSVPKAWTISFDTSKRRAGLVVQDLVLGINAHVNHDLPLALAEVSIDPDRDRRHQDHTAVNDALSGVTGLIKRRIEAMYAPALSVLDKVLSPVDDSFTAFSFVKARESAWQAAVALANARSDAERAAARQDIDDRSTLLARLIVSPTDRDPLLVDALQKLEKVTPWWEYVSLCEPKAGLPAPIAGDPPDVHTLEELMAGLEQVAARYDAKRSKMSILPAVYQFFTRRVTKLVDTPGFFEDPAWVTLLDCQFATCYFRALASFEAGRMDEVPACWLTAFQATVGNDAFVVQALALAINARLNHDLAIALFKSGLDDANLDKRRRDLEKVHAVFTSEIGPVLSMLAEKYTHILRLPNLVLGFLEEKFADFSYVSARDSAWDNAVSLTRAASDEERQALAAEMDRRATVLAQQILLKKVIGSRLVVHAIEHLEDSFAGSWSAFVMPPE